MMIDFHSHVLPSVDDGSASVEESIAMLRKEAEQGITHVVATPHFYPRHDSPERFLARRDKAEKQLREEMAKHDGLPQLLVGAEVYFFQGISETDVLSELTINGNGCILLEMTHSPWSDTMYREIENIYDRRGITPIIAHVDRYIGVLKTYNIPNRLAELPVYVQANAEFFLNRLTSHMALRLLKEQKIHLLGSDCHNLSSRAPNLGSAAERIRKNLGQDALDRVNWYGNHLLFDREKIK